MTSNPSNVWTSVELYSYYINKAGADYDTFSLRSLAEKVLEFFSRSLLELHVQGSTSVLCFKDHLPYKLHKLHESDNNDVSVKRMIKQIVKEAKSIEPEKNYDFCQFLKTQAINQTSETLLSIVAGLVSNGEIT